jgi:hypothetical protein
MTHRETDRRFVLATGAALFAAPAALAHTPTLNLRDLYKRGQDFSDLAQQLEGQRVRVAGFMAPPLKANSSFFVLTKTPMAVCPFCESAAEWPETILAIYTKRRLRTVPFNKSIDVTGVLQLGEATDADTGFVSLVRLANATYR